MPEPSRINVYDTMASDFDRHRPLPDGVPETIRDAILRSGLPPQPRILDLGAGSGRIGRSFVLAGDDYTGADLSFGMLRAFADRTPCPRLIQADAARLPFPDGTFDAVLLIQVLSRASGWRDLLTDAMRVLRPAGRLIVGRVVAPDDGIDAQMKSRLAAILEGMDLHPYRNKPRNDALSWLAQQLPDPTILTAATWVAERSPNAFLTRHGEGARFSVLDPAVKHETMCQLAAWASQRFGPPDTAFPEHYSFELIIHRRTPT
jgi:ubiquinone/menaquinone biosynthesis C-methylase UbiE